MLLNIINTPFMDYLRYNLFTVSQLLVFGEIPKKNEYVSSCPFKLQQYQIDTQLFQMNRKAFVKVVHVPSYFALTTWFFLFVNHS